jgi:hypothetical protein
MHLVLPAPMTMVSKSPNSSSAISDFLSPEGCSSPRPPAAGTMTAEAVVHQRQGGFVGVVVVPCRGSRGARRRPLGWSVPRRLAAIDVQDLAGHKARALEMENGIDREPCPLTSTSEFFLGTFLSTEIRLRLLEAPQGLDLRPPIRKAIDVEDDVPVRRERDIEGDRCEVEVGEAQLARDEGR